MRNHPLTPMTDANLVRVLQSQTASKVGLLRYDTVARGVDATRERIAALRAEGVRLAVADAIDNDDLRTLARACADLPLITAGSGVALGLPEVYAERGWLVPDAQAATLRSGRRRGGGDVGIVLESPPMHRSSTGSAPDRPGFRIDALALADGEPLAEQALDWADAAAGRWPGADLCHRRAAAGARGPGRARHRARRTAGRALPGADRRRAGRARGVRRLVVAGGETSGAVVQALGMSMRCASARRSIPGVPWTRAEGRPLLLALKSGNFGSVDFFAKALAQVD